MTNEPYGETRVKSLNSPSTPKPWADTLGYWVSTGLPTGGNVAGSSRSEVLKKEKIAYTVSPASKPFRFNVCNHWRFLRTMPVIGGTYVLHENGLIYYPTCHWVNGHSESGHLAAESMVGNMDDYFSQEVIPFPFASDSGLVDLAFAELQPDLTVVSLPNFIFELKDLKRTFSFLTTLRRQGKLSVPKGVAGAHLSYEYGVKPTFGDVSSSINAISSLMNRLDRWNSYAGQFMTRGKEIYSDTTSDSGSFVDQGTNTVTWDLTEDISVSAWIKYKTLPVKGVNDFSTKLRLLLDTYGFELNAAIVWNAIPFSFVVDYFLNVQKVLDQFRIDTLELPVSIVDSCLQMKRTRKLTTVTTSHTEIGHTNVTNPTCVTSGTYFARIPCTVGYVGLDSYQWSLPTWGQAGKLFNLATVLKNFTIT